MERAQLISQLKLHIVKFIFRMQEPTKIRYIERRNQTLVNV